MMQVRERMMKYTYTLILKNPFIYAESTLRIFAILVVRW